MNKCTTSHDQDILRWVMLAVSDALGAKHRFLAKVQGSLPTLWSSTLWSSGDSMSQEWVKIHTFARLRRGRSRRGDTHGTRAQIDDHLSWTKLRMISFDRAVLTDNTSHTAEIIQFVFCAIPVLSRLFAHSWVCNKQHTERHHNKPSITHNTQQWITGCEQYKCLGNRSRPPCSFAIL